jgi:poly-gamma-glutamate capsule biosynthesis protein CapA/YwtB (metallophosphatase superfamily)
MSRPNRAITGTIALVAALIGVAACGGDEDVPGASAGPSTAAPDTTASSAPPSASVAPPPSVTAPPEAPATPITIAFAGDVHFEGRLEGRLDDPATAMGPMAVNLAAADLAIVNLETAVTTRGTPESKEFTFRAPPEAFVALSAAGIDVATMANNHGLDYGPVSVPDALDAANAAGFPVIGIGADDAQAFKPWIAEVKGQRVGFIGATAVMDSALVSSWSAGPGHPGVATALDGNNDALVAAVEALRPQVDTLVVDMHYGSDLQTCPTEIQRGVVDDVVAAGADIVVGQHAHVVLGGGYHGSAYVDYGLGNFQFYVSTGSATAGTGVLTLTVLGRDITGSEWLPGQIVDGLPTAQTGDAAEAAHREWESLRACAGLTDAPSAG